MYIQRPGRQGTAVNTGRFLRIERIADLNRIMCFNSIRCQVIDDTAICIKMTLKDVNSIDIYNTTVHSINTTCLNIISQNFITLNTSRLRYTFYDTFVADSKDAAHSRISCSCHVGRVHAARRRYTPYNSQISINCFWFCLRGEACAEGENEGCREGRFAHFFHRISSFFLLFAMKQL